MLRRLLFLFTCFLLLGADYLGARKYERTDPVGGVATTVTVFEASTSPQGIRRAVDAAFVKMNATASEDALASLKSSLPPGAMRDMLLQKVNAAHLARGRAIDAGIDALTAAGVSSTVIQGGPTVRVMGQPREGNVWRIGLEHPRNVDYAGVLELPGEGAVATEGGLKGKFSRVAVVSRRAALSEALAAAFLEVGPEKSFDIASALSSEGVEVVFFEDDGRTIRLGGSDGIQALLKDIEL